MLTTVLTFDAGTTDDVAYLKLHAPTTIDDTEDVVIQIMWAPESGYSSGDYEWHREYVIIAEDGNISPTGPSSCTEDPGHRQPQEDAVGRAARRPGLRHGGT